MQTAAAADDASRPRVELKLRPRVCTLSGEDTTCNTTVRAQWRSSRNESLCLLIVDRPHVRQCWENHQDGVYTVEVAFSEDLVVELRDAEQEDRVLASQAIAVIRQALQLRHRRRPPWNIFP